MNELTKNTRNFLEDESGLSTIEIVLILVVLISLVIAFKGSIKALLDTILSEINSLANQVY